MLFSAIDFDSKNCAMNGFFYLRPSRGPAAAWLLALLDWIHKRPFVHAPCLKDFFFHPPLHYITCYVKNHLIS